MFIFSFINDQILKMVWLSDLVTWLLGDLFKFNLDGKFGSSLHFFIYDTVKIMILLAVLIYFVSYIQSYFPPERTKKIIGRFNGITANLLGALLGTVTPFCSCSSIPLFIGFTNAGLPVGVTFSFLVSSPLVDLASVLLLASIFNWRIAIAYVLFGILLAVVSGTLLSYLKVERYVAPYVYGLGSADFEPDAMTRKERHSFAIGQVKEIVNKVWLYILIGVSIGALIHNVIPESVITALLGQDKWYSVPLATLVGIPMYADIFGTLPIAEALVSRGIGIGTALAFMMAVTALSLPSMILLKKVVQTRLLLIFVAIVSIGILTIGFIFNAFGYLLI
ncbi:MAG: hypothetical protein BGO41_04620 [Clostridiales bacterium 38-18]|nr:MAG: hypothetical protein BGO41_04620 [Clostridiales bacterium 38-18]